MDMDRDRHHPMTDDSEAETEIINGSKHNTPYKPKDGRADGSTPSANRTKAVDAGAHETRAIVSPSPINGKKRKVSSDESNRPSSRGQSRSRSLSTEASAPKKQRRDDEDASSEDDAQDEPPNDVGRRDARRGGRRPTALQTRSARSSVSRTDVSSPREDKLEFNRSYSPLRNSHRRSASHHAAAAAAAVSERERRTRRRVASSEVAADQDSPGEKPPPKRRRFYAVVTNRNNPAPSAQTLPRKQRDHHGRTALAKACDDGDEDKVQSLLAAHSDEVNMEDYAGNTPLQFACNAGHIEIVKMLLAAGANIDTCNRDGETPYKDAQDAGEDEILELLRGAGYDPSKAKSQHKQYPKNRGHFLVYTTKALLNYVKDGDMEAVGEVATNGVKIENRHVVAACEHGYGEILNLLLGLGGVGNPNPNKVKDVPMHVALRDGSADIAALLRAQPDFDPLGSIDGVPYYKAALKRSGPEWHAETRAFRDAFVEAKRAKGETVEEDEEMNNDKRNQAPDEEVAAEAGADEPPAESKNGEHDESDEKAEQKPLAAQERPLSLNEAQPVSKNGEADDGELNQPKTEEVDEGLPPDPVADLSVPTVAGHAEQTRKEPAKANSNGASKQESNAADPPAETGPRASHAMASRPTSRPVTPSVPQSVAQSNKAIPAQEPQQQDKEMDEDTAKESSVQPSKKSAAGTAGETPDAKPDAKESSEGASNVDAMDIDVDTPARPLPNGSNHDNERNGETAAKVTKSADKPSKVSTPAPEPEPEPEVEVPLGLANVLKQGKDLPLLPVKNKSWLMSVRDYITIEVFYLGELYPDCEPSKADDLYMLGFQASVILGHGNLTKIGEIKDPQVRTLPMTAKHRARVWWHAPIRRMITRDLHHDIAPRDVIKSSGLPWQEDPLLEGEKRPLLHLLYHPFEAAQKPHFLHLPDSHCMWVHFDDFLRLASPQHTPRMHDQYMRRFGRLHMDFEQDAAGKWTEMEGPRKPNVPEQYYLGGVPVSTPKRLV